MARATSKPLRIVCISDTHELHDELTVPAGDVLVHAGDFTYMSQRPSMLRDFNRWLGTLPHPVKIVVPGNHDFLLEASDNPAAMISNATLLINSGATIGGLRIWGSPMTPLYGGAFGRRDEADRRRIYAPMPADLDILVTHTPPYGILDSEHGSKAHGGCPVLTDFVAGRKPRLHVFGHIHCGYGMLRAGEQMFVNAALFTEYGDVDRHPILVELLPRTHAAE